VKYFESHALAFFRGLKKHNAKPWFEAHREDYEQHVRGPLTGLVREMDSRFADFAPEFVGDPKRSMFRLNRDIRFSADKSPYKTHMGAFAPLSEGLGWYVQLDAEGVFTAGGFYAHTKERTARYRAAVDDNTTGAELVTIMKALTKAGLAKGGDQVRTRPRGVPEDHPRLELMRHEALTAGHRLPDSVLSTPAKLLAAVRKDWRAIRPLNDWLLANIER